MSSADNYSYDQLLRVFTDPGVFKDNFEPTDFEKVQTSAAVFHHLIAHSAIAPINKDRLVDLFKQTYAPASYPDWANLFDGYTHTDYNGFLHFGLSAILCMLLWDTSNYAAVHDCFVYNDQDDIENITQFQQILRDILNKNFSSGATVVVTGGKGGGINKFELTGFKKVVFPLLAIVVTCLTAAFLIGFFTNLNVFLSQTKFQHLSKMTIGAIFPSGLNIANHTPVFADHLSYLISKMYTVDIQSIVMDFHEHSPNITILNFTNIYMACVATFKGWYHLGYKGKDYFPLIAFSLDSLKVSGQSLLFNLCPEAKTFYNTFKTVDQTAIFYDFLSTAVQHVNTHIIKELETVKNLDRLLAKPENSDMVSRLIELVPLCAISAMKSVNQSEARVVNTSHRKFIENMNELGSNCVFQGPAFQQLNIFFTNRKSEALLIQSLAIEVPTILQIQEEVINIRVQLLNKENNGIKNEAIETISQAEFKEAEEVKDVAATTVELEEIMAMTPPPPSSPVTAASAPSSFADADDKTQEAFYTPLTEPPIRQESNAMDSQQQRNMFEALDQLTPWDFNAVCGTYQLQVFF